MTRRENIGVYDRAFRRFFLGTHDPVRDLLKLEQAAQAHRGPRACSQIPATDPGRGPAGAGEAWGCMASDAKTLRRKSFPRLHAG